MQNWPSNFQSFSFQSSNFQLLSIWYSVKFQLCHVVNWAKTTPFLLFKKKNRNLKKIKKEKENIYTRNQNPRNEGEVFVGLFVAQRMQVAAGAKLHDNAREMGGFKLDVKRRQKRMVQHLQNLPLHLSSLHILLLC